MTVMKRREGGKKRSENEIQSKLAISSISVCQKRLWVNKRTAKASFAQTKPFHFFFLFSFFFPNRRKETFLRCKRTTEKQKPWLSENVSCSDRSYIQGTKKQAQFWVLHQSSLQAEKKAQSDLFEYRIAICKTN